MFGYKKGFGEGWQYGFRDGIKLVKIDDKITSLKGPDGIKSQDYWDGYTDCHKELEQSGVHFVTDSYLDVVRSRAYSEGHREGKCGKEKAHTKWFKEGYEQGRFDEFADRTSTKQAKKVKERMERQEHCPYCHEPFRPHRIGMFCSGGDVLVIKSHIRPGMQLGTSYVTIQNPLDGTELTHMVDPIKYCPECGRELGDDNDED